MVRSPAMAGLGPLLKTFPEDCTQDFGMENITFPLKKDLNQGHSGVVPHGLVAWGPQTFLSPLHEVLSNMAAPSKSINGRKSLLAKWKSQLLWPNLTMGYCTGLGYPRAGKPDCQYTMGIGAAGLNAKHALGTFSFLLKLELVSNKQVLVSTEIPLCLLSSLPSFNSVLSPWLLVTLTLRNPGPSSLSSHECLLQISQWLLSNPHNKSLFITLILVLFPWLNNGKKKEKKKRKVRGGKEKENKGVVEGKKKEREGK